MEPRSRKRLSKDCQYGLYAGVAVCLILSDFVRSCAGDSALLSGFCLFADLFCIPLLMLLFGMYARTIIHDRKNIVKGAASMFCYYLLLKFAMELIRFGFEQRIVISVFSDSGASWIFLAWGAYLCLTGLLQGRQKTQMFIAALLASLICTSVLSLERFPAALKLMIYLPYFLLGQALGAARFREMAARKWVRALCGLFLLAVLGLIVGGHSSQIYETLQSLPGNGLHKASGTASSCLFWFLAYLLRLSIAAAILALTIRVRIRFLDSAGRRFVSIYFWYCLLSDILNRLDMFGKFTQRLGESAAGRAAWIFFGLACAVILSCAFLEALLSRVMSGIYRLWEILTSGEWSTKEYLAAYTFFFFITFLMIWSPFLTEKKVFIWFGDGCFQHYAWMVYLGRVIRKTIYGFLHGQFELPMFELTAGLGDDIIGMLGTNGAMDPLLILSAAVPVRYSEYLYAFLIILRLYLAGLCFAFLCSYFKKKKQHILIGSIVYCFCGYAIYCSMRHPYFVNPMILLPLLIVGLDKILNAKKPFLFIFSVFYAGLCGFYHMYMLSILLFLYGVVRSFDLNLLKKPVRFLRLFWRAIYSYCLGLGMSAIVFLPMVAEFLSARRAGFSHYYGSYSWDFYRTMLLTFIAPPSEWDYMSFAAIVLLALILLFFSRKRRALKTLVVISLAIYFSSIGGLVMNGFQYTSNRWTFALSLVMACVVVEMLPELMSMSSGQKLCGLALLCGYLWAAFSTRAARGSYILVGLCFLAITLFVMTTSLWENLLPAAKEAGAVPGKRRDYQFVACLLLVAVNCGANGFCRFATDQAGYAREFRSLGTEVSGILNSIGSDARDCLDLSGGRIDSTQFELNATLSAQVPGMLTYSSTANGDMLQYWYKTENSGHEALHLMRSTGQRTIAETLLSQKYQIESPNREAYLPYGYTPYLTTPKGNQVYLNQYALPWGYTYDRAVSYEEIEPLNGVQTQEAMLQAVAIETLPGGNEPDELHFDSYEVPFEAEYANCQWEDGTLTVSEAGATITLRFAMPGQVEEYVRLAGFDANDSGLTSFWVNAASGSVNRSACVTSDLYTWYYGKENYLINLGYSEEERDVCTITFPAAGTFKLKNIEVYALPMAQYPEKVEALRSEPLENIQMSANRISGTVDLSGDKYLCVSFPYSKGWSAKVDGEKTEVLRGNYMFLTIPLKAGHHEVEFSYCSPGLRLGLAIAAVCACIVLLLRFTVYRRKER